MSDSSASFLCPISYELIRDPVIDPDDNSYVKNAIEDLIHQSDISPITRQLLSIHDVRPNRALNIAIDEYHHSIQSDIKSNSLLINVHSSEITISTSYTNEFIHISIQPPQDESRSSCDICCVVDTSGSMSESAEIQNDKNEQYDLSQLDLVKHALKTIINSLQSQDRLSIVSFSDNAKILFRLTKMDDEGKTNALAAVKKLSSYGSTNLWDGLQTGLEILSKEQHSIGSISALFLLTDGCPNVEPPGGHLKSLKKLKKETNFTCVVNTFGFGYNLNSKLLEDISILGNCGSYAFIPDGSFVGTIFVNAISTLLTTVATNVQLLVHSQHLPPTDYTRWYSTNSTSEGTYFHLGSITYGQSKDLLIPHSRKFTAQCKFTLTYGNTQNVKKSITFNLTNNLQQADLDLITRHKFRLEFVHYVRTALEKMCEIKTKSMFKSRQHKAAINQIQKLEDKMRKYADGKDEFIKDLFTDLTGQVKQAIEKEDWFNKWGIHFLPSLTCAHLLQFCNNFKDPGVQHYGNGKLFSEIRDEMDDIFCSLPAPKCSKDGAKINMSVFYNAAGGCFYGECKVHLMNGTTKLIKDIKPGDRIAPHGGMIRFVVKTICQNQKANMVIVENDLIITAWHPIRYAGEWIMPCSLVSSVNEISCEAIYNFVLDQGHTMLVNDVECVTLGHGFKEDVVRHSYYGSERVINDLERLNLEQNNGGLIEITEKMLVRSIKSGLVNGLQSQQILVQ
ncbi:unnamed protein product [Rotaria sordida]|uniref:VWFA domain-containing protein n=1 Tax=Rotaria sordida TaxID=392033 RepID=A0A813XCE0_9BILA|nr:unnamed protein product [Rotaria sordida]